MTSFLDLRSKVIVHSEEDFPLRVSIAPDTASAWQAAPQGCVILCGTISLPDDSVLLLSGAGCSFHGTVFKGGRVVCAGDRFSGAFWQCTFTACTLYVINGASLTLRGCRFTSCAPAIIAHSPASTLVAVACTIARCDAGIIIRNGASATLSESLMTGTKTAIDIADLSSCCALLSSHLHGRGRARSVGVHAYGGSVRMSHCHMREFETGVCAEGTAPPKNVFLDFYRCWIQCQMGVVSFGATRACFRRCRIDGGEEAGVSKGVRVFFSSSPDLDPSCRGSLTMQHCYVVGCPRVCAPLSEDGDLRCPATHDFDPSESLYCDCAGWSAVYVHQCRAAALMCRITCGSYALLACHLSAARLSHCWITSSRVCCLATAARELGSHYVGRCGTRLWISDCRLTGSVAVSATMEAAITVVDCVMKGYAPRALYDKKEAEGLVRVTMRAVGKLLRCHFRDTFHGVDVSRSCLTAINCHMALECPGDHGVVFGFDRDSESSDKDQPDVFQKGRRIACCGYMCSPYGTLTIKGGSVDSTAVGVLAGDPARAGDSAIDSQDGPEHDPVPEYRVHVDDVVFTRSRCGVTAMAPVEICVRRCRFLGCAEKGAALLASKLLSISTGKDGARSQYARRLCTPSDHELWQDGHKIGIKIWNGTCGTVVGCQFFDMILGLQSSKLQALTVSECDFQTTELGSGGRAARSICVTHCTGVHVSKCRFEGDGDGVVACCSEVSVVGCHMQRGIACAVAAFGSPDDEASLTVRHCEFLECCIGLQAGNAASVRVEDTAILNCTESAVSVAGNGGSRLVCTRCELDGASVLIELERVVRSGSDSGGHSQFARSNVIIGLADSRLANAGTGLRVWGSNAAVAMQQCSVDNCDVGLYMVDDVSVAMKDCSIERCEWGALVGLSESDVCGKCWFCEQRGPKFWHTARRRLGEGPSDVCEDAPHGQQGDLERCRCAHEGATARLNLRGVNLHDCDTALRVNEFGLLNADRVNLRSCGQGVSITHVERSSGEGSVLRGCSVYEGGDHSDALRVWPLGAADEDQCLLTDVPGLQCMKAIQADVGPGTAPAHNSASSAALPGQADQ